jgi:pimeloyl-ACP methyl ester carboxylesterase
MNLVLLAAENPSVFDSAIFVHGAAAFTEEDMADYATRYPQVMAEYAAFQEEIEANPDLTDAERTEMMKKLWLEDWFPVSTADPESAALMFDELFGYAQFSWPHADHGNRENPTFDARDRLPLITARCLVIAGAHDMMPVEMARELAEGLSDAEFMVFENSGHFAPAEETAAFTATVWEFLGVE